VTLAIHAEEDSERQLKVTVEVPEERVQAQMRKTARNLAQQVRFPGFRKGKVPYNILVRRVGEEALRADAVEEMLEDVLAEALEEVDTTPYRQPSLDDMDMDPLVIKLTIPLEPEVKLGDYRATRKEIQPIEVSEEALEEALEHVREHHHELEDVDRPAGASDMVTLSGEGKTAGDEEEVIWHEHESDVIMDPDKTFPKVPFVENIIGMSAGEEKSFQFNFPEDYEEDELADKHVEFNVKVDKVQSREVPELSDELAQQEGDYETLDELKEGLTEQLQNAAEQQAKSDLLDEMVDDMLTEAEIVFPPVAVESELDGRIENLKEQVTRSGWKWEDYMRLQGETEESLREQWHDDAVEQVRRGLVLRQFVADERLTVDSADIDAAVEERLNQFDDNEELRENLRNVFTQGQGLEMMSNDILLDKVYERMKEIVTGNAPDLDALIVEDEVTEEEEE
jgi:trigger factor